MSKSKGLMHGEINKLSVHNAAYIAGIIDADGMVSASINYRRRRLASPLVIVTNGDMALIDWLKVTIGAGTNYRSKCKPCRDDQTTANWNPVHRYQITGWKAISLLRQILPYMRVKRERALLVIKLPVRGRDFPLKCPEDLVCKSEHLLVEIRRLNKRGIVPLKAAA